MAKLTAVVFGCYLKGMTFNLQQQISLFNYIFRTEFKVKSIRLNKFKCRLLIKV